MQPEDGLHILGTASASPSKNRFPSAHLLKIGGRFFLLDCGEGTQMQLRKYKLNFNRIEAVCITHLHGDHFYGLIGLISTFSLLGRTKLLKIIAPKELKEILEIQLKASGTMLSYRLDFVDTRLEDILFEDQEIKIQRILLNHRVFCAGFLFTKKSGKRKINLQACHDHEIPKNQLGLLQKGKDFTKDDGSVIQNELLTLKGAKQKKMAYCTDTRFFPEIIKQLKDVDLLYHEATFLDTHAQRAEQTFHSTAKQAASIALKANVKQLILSHFSARYKGLEEFKKEAQEIFDNVVLAKEGMFVSF